MNLRALRQKERAALPAINRALAVVGAVPLKKLNLRCHNVVGSCPVARAFRPIGLQQVYSGVLTGEAWDKKADDFVDDLPKLRVVARAWSKRIRQRKFRDFCCHRHFDEATATVELPQTIIAFIDAFAEYREAIGDW